MTFGDILYLAITVPVMLWGGAWLVVGACNPDIRPVWTWWWRPARRPRVDYDRIWELERELGIEPEYRTIKVRGMADGTTRAWKRLPSGWVAADPRRYREPPEWYDVYVDASGVRWHFYKDGRRVRIR